MRIRTATKQPTPMAVYRIWMPVADGLSSALSRFPWVASRYVITMPRPFSSAASGSSSGSAHGANLRTARWPTTMMTTKAARYSAIEAGSLPFRLYPTFANAKATSANANASMMSSAPRRPGATGTGRSGSTAGVGAVTVLTVAARGSEAASCSRARHNELPAGVVVTRSLAGMPNASEGWQNTPTVGAVGGLGLAMWAVGLLFLWARATSARYLLSMITQSRSAVYCCWHRVTAERMCATELCAWARLLGGYELTVCWSFVGTWDSSIPVCSYAWYSLYQRICWLTP